MMNQRQTEFFAALTAPIPRDELRTRSQAGRTFTYITPRTLYIRLDEVAGPGNWYTEYTETKKGFSCKLYINVPDDDPELGGDPGERRRWMFKEDGGGFAGMPENDNDAKSGYSDAAKRAGAVWGIARELYGDGVPDYIEAAQAPAPHCGPPPQQQQRQAPPQQQRQAPPQNQSYNPSPPQNYGPPQQQRQAPPQQQQAPQGQGGYDNFKVPPAGKAVFAWAKGLERIFGTGIVQEMDSIAKRFGYGNKFNEWDQTQVEYVVWSVIDMLRTWASYEGQFDHLQDPREVPI